ncbi:TPA: FAD-dependent oxidoreductase [Candidatus Woesearchaeota archaeon]|nr:MAG: hypothetical protein QT07_C0005G0023 [archaeon GW2011_AR16]HIG96546.1 FAD-dependent oxidoreductase [Candidatus Woesearchaeota archaeon]HIH47637.1 FAD-dependent oxidoreductase [Candidatus Woesearchaeota archaeon]HII88955.1 FAD-dependent oxidoreductase [Candidatus Woesearchaeota archaeon]
MKKVVIIGGGFAGAYAAQHLERDFDVTLIDLKDYFEFTPGILRTIVEPEHIKNIQVLHTHYLKRARFIRAEVKTVTPKYVLFDGKRVPYDYLLICSGSRYHTPFKEKRIVLSTRAEHLRQYYDQLCKAKDILIIGGGVVGVELAAEIATHCKKEKGRGKTITIAHAHDRFLTRNNQKAIDFAERFLTKHGVKIMYNERVMSHNGKTFITESGKKIKADLAFLCTGIQSNSGFMKKHFAKKLNEREQIEVNAFLQVEGSKNIFVCGDVNNSHEEKTAQSAEKQAMIAVENLYRLEQHSAHSTHPAQQSLVAYYPTKKPMVISLGKWCGIFVWGRFTWCGVLPGILKNLVEWKTMIQYR